MSNSDHSSEGVRLPDTIRASDRPIIIYQGPPPGEVESLTGNSMGLLSWLALLTAAMVATTYFAWAVWNPAYNSEAYSPISDKGRPVGLAGQVSERTQINALSGGLYEYLEDIRNDTLDRRRSNATHPLITDRGGIDELRQDWDAMCRRIRDGIYDRRVAAVDVSLDDARRRRALARDAAEIAVIETELKALTAKRAEEVEKRRTDSDPSLRCIPAEQAPECGENHALPWCNPQLQDPKLFGAVKERP
jgi:hypothetical protein